MLVFALYQLVAGDVAVEKRTFFKFPFRGVISDISQCRVDRTNQILILAQNHGVLINEQKVVQKEFALTRCFDPKASQIGDAPCIVYCRGGGFSPVYAADLNGHELWKFDRPGTVSTVARDGDGRFFVCTFREVSILDQDGKFTKSINKHIYDIRFVGPSTTLTISAITNKSRGRQMDIRDADFNRLNSFPIESDGRNILAYNWPETNHFCYASKQDLVVLNQGGKALKRVSLEDVAVGVGSVVVKDDVGEEYLVLLALYKPGKASSKLFIFSKRFERVYEESLPISFTVSTLGTSNRFYVGVGMTEVVEYRFGKKR
jgi:hypothetical protein